MSEKHPVQAALKEDQEESTNTIFTATAVAKKIGMDAAMGQFYQNTGE